VSGDELDTIQRTGRLLAASGYFDAKGESPQAIAQMAAKILAGRELGFGPFAAVQGIHIISGKPAVGANLMAAAVKGSGRYDYRVRSMSDEECIIEFFETVASKRESIGVSSFTLKDAQAAAVTNNPTWKKFPRNMLFARAMSNGVRWYCPDVFSGNSVYVPEELGATVDGDGNVIDAPVRVVEASTGEILTPAANVDGDWVFEQPQHIKRLHALGREVYGEAWDSKRAELVSAISGGRIRSSAELTEAEVRRMIAGMEAKLAQSVK
jgi:hypothetical protein